MAATSASSTDYLYNALGQMIEKSGTLGTTTFMQDEAGHLIGEYDGSGNLIEETVWLGDIPVATLQPNGSGGVNIFYIHTDHLNAPRKVQQPVTDALVWRWDTDPFGTAAPNENPSGLGTFPYNLRFPGQYYQAETGLNYNYFRDYDPVVGRYVESDPIGLRGGSYSTYEYARGSPTVRVDPSGLFAPPPWVVPGWLSVPSAAVTVDWWVSYAVGSAIYNAYDTQVQNGLDWLFGPPGGAVSPATSTGSSGLPPAANDPNYHDPGCPRDCREWKTALNRMYQGLLNAEKANVAAEYMNLRWQQFNNFVKAYQKACGPYSPPPSTEEVYTK